MIACRITCPLCGRGERDRTLIVFDSGRVHFHRGCSWREIRDALGDPEFEPQPRVTPQTPRHDGLAPWAAELWNSSLALSGVAVAYLTARACVIPPTDADLRWHPEMRHRPTGHVGAAFIALVTDAISNRPISLHRTWIRRDGAKPVKPARMLNVRGLLDHFSQTAADRTAQ